MYSVTPIKEVNMKPSTKLILDILRNPRLKYC